MVDFPKINPKAQFIDLCAAKGGRCIATQPFKSLLGGTYTEVAAKTPVEEKIAIAPQPSVGRLWRPT